MSTSHFYFDVYVVFNSVKSQHQLLNSYSGRLFDLSNIGGIFEHAKTGWKMRARAAVSSEERYTVKQTMHFSPLLLASILLVFGEAIVVLMCPL